MGGGWLAGGGWGLGEWWGWAHLAQVVNGEDAAPGAAVGVLQANELTDRVVGAPQAPCDHPLQLSQVQGAAGQVWEGVGVHPRDLQVLGKEGGKIRSRGAASPPTSVPRLLPSSGPSSLPLCCGRGLGHPSKKGRNQGLCSPEPERRVLRVPTRGQQSAENGPYPIGRGRGGGCWAAAAPTWSVWEWLPFQPPWPSLPSAGPNVVPRKLAPDRNAELASGEGRRVLT